MERGISVNAQVVVLVGVWLVCLPFVYRYARRRIATGAGTAPMVLLALLLVSVPVIPVPGALRDFALLSVVPWVIGFSMACVLLVGTRRIIAMRSPGAGLPHHRLAIVPIVGRVTLNIFKYLVIVTWALSVLAYNLAMVSEVYNPFGVAFSIGESVVFHLDQAMKGMLLDVMAVFDLGLGTSLRVSASEHPVYSLVLLAYRLFCSTFVIGALTLMIVRYLGGKRAGESL
jgi:hypothetical protein